mmetsp:Transcript_2237/g.14822  ORF Transcript_2237/g.14822 Transcript_2237/m.14822 type:complete len:90 (-) Transcript_2237:601-870(-)
MSRWLKPEVYPLLVAVGGGVTVCAAHLTRMVFFSPDCLVSKTSRGMAIPEEDKWTEVGHSYREHPLRRFLRDKNTMIMPSLNESMSSPK